MREAWEQVGLKPELIREPLDLPRLTFGTWVGGDRDGHPLVTPQVRQPANKNVPTNPLLGGTVGSRGSFLLAAMPKGDLKLRYFA